MCPARSALLELPHLLIRKLPKTQLVDEVIATFIILDFIAAFERDPA